MFWTWQTFIPHPDPRERVTVWEDTYYVPISERRGYDDN